MKLFKSIAIVIAMLMAISTVSFNQVVEVDAAAMKLNYSKKDLQVKKSFTLKVKNAKKKKIKWSSSKKKVAKVSKKGKVKGLKEGKAIITAKIGKKKLKCTVTVLTKAHYKAVKAAKNWVKNNKGLSRNQLMNLLVGADKLSKANAKYAIDHSGINWNKNAAEFAEEYIKDNTDEVDDSSRDVLKEYLTVNGFTSSEADYAVKHAKIDWKKEAVKSAKFFLKYNAPYGASRKDVEEELAKAHYTKDEIQYAINNCGIDWYGRALSYAKKSLSDNPNTGRLTLKEDMEMEYFDAVDINRVLAQGINWKEAALNFAKYYITENDDADKNELRSQLKANDYTTAEIEYAVTNCSEEWKGLAYKSAKAYLIENPSYTEKELIDMIKDENRGLTDAEISAGVEQALSELPA